MSLVDRLAEIRGGYKVAVCRNSSCQGCADFANKLRSSASGQEALDMRFPEGSCVHDPFSDVEHGGVRVCLRKNRATVPSAVADGQIDSSGTTVAAHIGVIRDPEERGKGYGRIVVMALAHELKRRGVAEVCAEIDAENSGSQKMAFALGATQDLDCVVDEKDVVRFLRKL